MQWYGGQKPIASSLGDFAGYGVLSSEGNRGIGASLSVTLAIDGGFVDATLRATRIADGGCPADDPGNAAPELSNRLSVEDFGGNAALVGDDGRVTPP